MATFTNASPCLLAPDSIIEIVIGTEDVGHFYVYKKILVESSKFFEAEVKKPEEQDRLQGSDPIIKLPGEKKEVFRTIIKWLNDTKSWDRWLTFPYDDLLEIYKLIETLGIMGYKNLVMDVIRRSFRNMAVRGKDVARACRMFPDPDSPVRNFHLDQLAWYLRLRHEYTGHVWEEWSTVPKESYDLLPELVVKIMKNPNENAAFMESCVYHDHEGEKVSCEDQRKRMSQLRKRSYDQIS